MSLWRTLLLVVEQCPLQLPRSQQTVKILARVAGLGPPPAPSQKGIQQWINPWICAI